MFGNLTQRLTGLAKRLSGHARLTDDNTREGLREVRLALLEADVALPVVKDFIEHVRLRAQGREVLESLTPGQMLVKVVHDELVRLMGEQAVGLDLAVRPPAVVLVAGLQGAGKTTTVGKLARYLREREKKSVLVASADVYRPAAIQQLETVAAQAGAVFFPSMPDQQPVAIAGNAVAEAKRRGIDVVVIDSAGRLHVDAEMMQEIRALHTAVNPVETLFVVDSTTGQDAVNTARAFHEALPLTGLILTKTDGDARGGAALSMRAITGRPIKFLGTGEKLDDLEPFHPSRMAARILGMGDVLSLVEDATRTVDRDKAEAMAKKVIKGKGFNLEDFRDQLQQMEKMGGVAGLMDKLPGMGQVPEAARSQFDDRRTRRMIAIINSMTPAERRDPAILRGSRKRRIAAGSGVQVQDVNQLLRQFDQIQTVMKRFGKGGAGRLLQGLKGRLPGFPG